MSRIFKNRRIGIFFLWYSCLFLIVGLLVTFIFIKEVRQERETYMLSLEQDADNIIKYLDQNFTAIVNTCNSIFSSTWYNHYRNVANIYKDEFNGMKKIEIMNDIASKVTALPFVSDILIITPFPEQNVICKNGWFTFDDYEKFYGQVKIELPEKLTEPPVIEKASESVCFMTLQDITPRRIQSVICIIIDKKSFANTLRRIIPERSMYVKTELNGQILFEVGYLDDTLVVNSAKISMPALSLTIASPSYENSLMKQRTVNYILVMLIVLLAGAILSNIITMVVLKPLEQIIKRIGGNFRQLEDPYYFISEYVEISSEQNKRLAIEKESLNKSMERFLSLMRDEIFFGILTNPNFNFYNEYTYTSVPWINDGNPYVLAVLEPKFQGESELPNSSAFEELSGIVLHFCTFSILYNDICILLWFKDKEDADEKYDEVKERISNISEEKYLLSFSTILQDIRSMGESYLAQKAEIAEQRHTQLDLPISFQIELISKLQKNKHEECKELLHKVKTIYNPSAIMRLLVRIASKYNINPEDAINQYHKCIKRRDENELWNVLDNFVGELCKAINDVKSVSMDETAEIIRKYIDEHYCDPNLCMKQLSDHFSMHRTLISKILKEHLGMTFSEYLL